MKKKKESPRNASQAEINRIIGDPIEDYDSISTPQALLLRIESSQSMISLAQGAGIYPGQPSLILVEDYFRACEAYIELRKKNPEYPKLERGHQKDNEEIGLMDLKDWCIDAGKLDTPAAAVESTMPGKDKRPPDLIPLKVAVAEYEIQTAQLKRDIYGKKLKSYRLPRKKLHWVSRRDLDQNYIKRPNSLK